MPRLTTDTEKALVVQAITLLCQSDGSQNTFILGSLEVAEMFKDYQVMVKVIQGSTANAKVGLQIQHSPDGMTWETHSTPIAVTAITGAPLSAPEVVSGWTDSATNGPLSQFIRPVVVVDSADANEQWVTVMVYLVPKPT